MQISERELVRQRLSNQKLTHTACREPLEVVAWLCAVQAQEYAPATWALGLRADGLTDAAVDRAFNDGAILRTHVMRPTWHFVAPADIRWMLALTAPRVNAVSAYYYRKNELDEAVFARSRKTLERALRDGKQLTRAELAAALARAGIPADTMRLGLLMLRAELDQVVCSGARRGKQFTYALLEERVPRARSFTREEALAELTRRYFTSHGPATITDYAWWSGLTVGDVKRGIELVRPALGSETIGDRVYWFAASPPATPLRPASREAAARGSGSAATASRVLASAALASRSTARARTASRSIGSPSAGSDATAGRRSLAVDTSSRARSANATASAHLLPIYDEYLIAYKDRDPVVSPSSRAKTMAAVRGPDPFAYHLVLDGLLAGSWRRTVQRQSILVEVVPYQPLTRANMRALSAAAERYGRFMEMPVELSVQTPA